jgi:hypothetical protein
MDSRQAAGVLAQCKWLRDQIKIQEDAAKAVLQRELRGGERAVAELPDGTELGSVTMAQGAKSMQIDNEAGFIAWVASKYPSEIERAVRPAFVKQCAEKVKELGHLPDANGVPCPHVSLAVADPKVSTNLPKDADYRMQQLIESRTLPTMFEYPAIAARIEAVDAETGEVIDSTYEVVEDEPPLEPEPDLEDMGPPHWNESGTFENSDTVRRRRGAGN